MKYNVIASNPADMAVLGKAVRSQNYFDNIGRQIYAQGGDHDYPSNRWMQAKNWLYNLHKQALQGNARALLILR